MPKPLTANTLFYGDNLSILRDHYASPGIPLSQVPGGHPGRHHRRGPEAGQGLFSTVMSPTVPLPSFGEKSRTR